jgi:hypothetical protein
MLSFSFFGSALLFVLIVSCVSGAPDSAESPYPPSPVISGIAWDPPSTIVRKAPGSDNWPTTWASDGNLYASWGDGGGFGGTNRNGRVSLGVARMVGNPDTFVGQNVWGGENGEAQATFEGKSYGLLSVARTLYMWVGPRSGWTSSTETRLAWSDDLGKTWELSQVFFRYTDGFSLPAFLNFGKDYAGARDTLVYIYAYDASNGSRGPWMKINLARVPQDQIKNRAAYEFFKRLGTDGIPLWTTEVAQRGPVFSNPTGGVALPSVSYNPGISRYLLVVPHRTPTQPNGGLGIFDAPEPWGPWTTVQYTPSWFGSSNMFFASFPTKWMSDDGKTLYLVFTGFGRDAVARDAYQHIKGVLELHPGKTSTLPSSES